MTSQDDLAILIKNKLQPILDDARYAPSVHNSQPWLVSCGDTSINTSIDPSHRLVDGDPTGRETTISLGIFTEAVGIASRANGLDVKRVELVSEQEAVVWIAGKAVPTDTDTRISEVLKLRQTDRSIYTPVEVDKQLADELSALSDTDGVRVEVISDRSIIDRLAVLTGRAVNLALSSPSFRLELSRYLVLPFSRKRRGISTKSLYLPWPIAILQPLLLKSGIRLKKEGALEEKRWRSASGVIAILADGDLKQHWFDAGRIYLRVSLALEEAGLSQATSAAVVEASNYHEDVEEMLGTNQRILALIRVGRGSTKKYYSPRVDTKDLLTSH